VILALIVSGSTLLQKLPIKSDINTISIFYQKWSAALTKMTVMRIQIIAVYTAVYTAVL